MAAPCVNGTLQSYINLGAAGCSVGIVDYQSFTIVPGQNFATVINPASVTVTPGGSLLNTTLRLGLNQTAEANQLFDLIFRVRAVGNLTGASAMLGTPTATGDGVSTAVLEVCPGGNFMGMSPSGCSTGAQTAIAFADAIGPNTLTDNVAAKASFFDIFFDVSIDGGTAGRATLASATLGVNAVPEPSTMLLMALGLAAMAHGLRGNGNWGRTTARCAARSACRDEHH